MFQRKIILSNNNYIELASRIFNGEDRVMVSVVGSDSDAEGVVSINLLLTDSQLQALAVYANEATTRAIQSPGV